MKLADLIPCPGCGKQCPSQLEDVTQYKSETGAPQPGNQWLFCSDCNPVLRDTDPLDAVE